MMELFQRRNTIVKRSYGVYSIVLLAVFLVTGCATTQAKRQAPDAATASQIQAMQNELQIKDQQIQDLQYQLETAKQSSGQNFTAGNPSVGSKSGVIRVAGVSVSDVQGALLRAGFNPGPVDGKLGSKTKEAIKEFQATKGLKADGIVGEKTWSLLK